MPQTPAQKAANEKRRAFALSQKRGHAGRFMPVEHKPVSAAPAALTNATDTHTQADPLDIPNLAKQIDPVIEIHMPDKISLDAIPSVPDQNNSNNIDPKPHYDMPTHTIQREYHPPVVSPDQDSRKSEEHVIIPHPEAGKKPGFFGKLKSLFS